MADPNIAIPAALIGEPTRAAILMALCDGRSLAAGELAQLVGISAQSASNHLALLRDGGLVAVVQQGRYRFFRLASAAVAQSIEALATIAPALRSERLAWRDGHDAACHARKCYSHLAGRAGVELLEALIRNGYVQAGVPSADGRTPYALTPAGEAWLAELGIDARAQGRSCMDWTERREHLAGPLGSVLLRHLLAEGFLETIPRQRALRVTGKGDAFFHKLGVEPETRKERLRAA